MSNSSKKDQKRAAAGDPSKANSKRTKNSAPRPSSQSSTSTAAAPPPPAQSLSGLAIAFLAIANAFIPGENKAFFQSRTRWRQKLDRDDLLVGSKEFVKIFAKGEHLYLRNSKTAEHIRVHDDGTNYAAKIGNFEQIHFFKNKTGLGLEVPALTPANLRDYLDANKIVTVINSYDQEKYSTSMDELLQLLENPGGYDSPPYNLLSMECTTEKKLNGLVTVPTFVSENSIVQKLENLLSSEYYSVRILESRSHARAQYLEHKLDNMPHYQKFLLLSMAGSFTGVHVDPAATSVYYHVLHGKKIFYVCPPTKENMDVYKDFERNPDQSKWVGDVLFDCWQRIEINAGETAMIPAGWIHFVYTPVDSIVIGGNFLTEKSLKMQFEIASLEEELLKTKPNLKATTFEGFRNVMWMYMERILIPELRYARAHGGLSESLKARALLFQQEMDPLHKTDKDWKNALGKHYLLEELASAMGEPLANTRPMMGSSHRPVHNGPVRRSSRIKNAEKREPEEESDVEEEEDD